MSVGKFFIAGILVGGIFLSLFSVAGAQALRVLTAPQGGTGIGSATAGDIGKCLKVLNNSPYTYELGTCGSGGGGGSDTLWSWNSSTNIISSDGASTTATTSISTNGITANSATITNATSTTGWFSSVVRSLSAIFTNLTATDATFTRSTSTNATSTTFRTTTFGVGSDYITDITGTGLSISGGALTATNDHVAVTLSGTPDYITLSGQDIIRGTVDISDDTNLSVSATGLSLSGDAIAAAAGYSIPLTASSTNWNTFYDTPSTRITAGANCSWAGNTFNCSGGGGGSISTSSTPTAGNLAYWTSGSALSDVATGTLTETITGLELSATRGLVGGAAVLSLTSGYTVPTTSSTTEWGRAYSSTTALNATAPLVYTGTTGNLSIPAATGAQNGYLTSTDWTLFNQKVSSTSIDTSAELAALLTDETGTGFSVFSASPTFTGTSIFNQINTAGITVTGSSTLGYASSTALTVSGNTILAGATTTSLGVSTLTAANCDVKATTNGAFYCGLDVSAAGGAGIATSGPIADTEVIYGTSAGTVDSESAFTYNATTDLLTVPQITVTTGTTTNGTSTTYFASLLNATAASILGLTGTNATITSATTTTFRTTNLAINTDVFTDLTGTGLQNSAGVLTLNATGDWTGTLDGFEGATLAQTNWLYNGTRLSPSSTVGIGVFASSTLTELNFTNATGTQSTTTNLFATLGRFVTASTTYASTSDLTIYQSLYDTNSSRGSSGQFLMSTGTSTLWSTFSVAGDGVSNWSYDGTRLTPTSTTAGVLVNGSSTISLLSFSSATGTNATTTNFRTTQLGVGTDYITDITGAGLQNSAGALTLNATGDWTGTLDGFEGATLAQTNWTYNGTRLSPSTTVGIGVFASSTITEFNFTNATGTNATATTIFATNLRSTNASSTYASTTGLSVSSGLSLFGNTSVGTTNALCILLTGSSDLCDGSDASGGGGGSSNWVLNAGGDALTPSSTKGIVINASSSITSLTTQSATTTNLAINSERFTDLTGFGLANNSNALGLDTTGAADGECLKYNSTGPAINWDSCGGGGSSKWTDGTNFTYLTQTTYDLALGSNATATAPFWWDVSATTSYIGNGGAGDSVVTFGTTGTEWTMGFDDTDDSFRISSSTSLGQFDFLKLSSTSTLTYVATSSTDYLAGVQMLIGRSLPSYMLNAGQNSTLFVNGPAESSFWYLKCDPSRLIIAPAVDTAVGNICGDAIYGESSNNGNSYTTTMNLGGETVIPAIALAEGTAGHGVGYWFDRTAMMALATTTPRLDALVQVGLAGTTTNFVGFSTQGASSSISQSFSTFPTQFVGFFTVSTTPTWQFTVKTAEGASTTFDTGIATATAVFLTVQSDGGYAYGYIGSTTAAKRLVNPGGTSIAPIGGTRLAAGVYGGRPLAGLGTNVEAGYFLKIGYMELWRQKPYMYNNY